MTQSGQLHEISALIGELKEGIRSTRHEVKNLSAKFDGGFQKLQTDLEKLEEAVDLDKSDLAKLRAKGAGVLIGVSLASGFLGAKASAIATAVVKLAS
jgi:hypothetical protein